MFCVHQTTLNRTTNGDINNLNLTLHLFCSLFSVRTVESESNRIEKCQKLKIVENISLNEEIAQNREKRAGRQNAAQGTVTCLETITTNNPWSDKTAEL
jgi:hypothetical protein